MSDEKASGNLMILAALVFVVSVVALVTLEVMGKPTANLMTLVSPVVAALFVAGHINRVTAKQNETIQKIEQQTNGVLDQRIKDGVLAALNARGEDTTI